MVHAAPDADRIAQMIRHSFRAIPGVTGVEVHLADEQRASVVPSRPPNAGDWIPIRVGEEHIGAVSLAVGERETYDAYAPYLRNVISVAALRIDHARQAASLRTLNRELEERVRDRTGRLAESEERFRAVVQHAPEAILLWDRDAERVVEANAQAERLFGWTRSELIGRTLSELSDSEPADELLERYRRAHDAEKSERFEWTHLRHGHPPVLTEVQLVALKFGTRRLVRASITDISARRALEGALRQAHRLEGLAELTGGVAHDFNNLLMVVVATLSEIQEEEGLSADGAQSLTDALSATVRASGLTRQLLAFARQQPLEPKATALDELAEVSARLMRHALGKQATLELALESGASVLVDARGLEDALLNLARNARDASGGGCMAKLITGVGRAERATLTTGAEPELWDYAFVALSDDGPGMSADVLARACEPYFTTKPVGLGNGLGLARVHGFVAQSGGELCIVSSDVGTRVELRFPLLASG